MVFTWEASAFSNHLTVSHQAEYTNTYQVACWLLFWIEIILSFKLPNFQPTSKSTHGYLPGCYSLPFPFLWQYSSLGAISTRMLQSEGITIMKKKCSDLHDLARLSFPNCVPCPCCSKAHCRLQPVLVGWQTNSPFFSSPCGHLALFQWLFFQFNSFLKAETFDHHLSFTKLVKSVLNINKCHIVWWIIV